MLIRELRNQTADLGTRYVVTVDFDSKIVNSLEEAANDFPADATIHDHLGPVYNILGHRMGSITKLRDPRSERDKLLEFLKDFKINHHMVGARIILDDRTLLPDQLTFKQVRSEPGWSLEGYSLRYRNIVCTPTMQWLYVHENNDRTKLQFPPRTLDELRLLMVRAE